MPDEKELDLTMAENSESSFVAEPTDRKKMSGIDLLLSVSLPLFIILLAIVLSLSWHRFL